MTRRIHLIDPHVWRWSRRAVCGLALHVAPRMQTTAEESHVTCRTCLALRAWRANGIAYLRAA